MLFVSTGMRDAELVRQGRRDPSYPDQAVGNRNTHLLGANHHSVTDPPPPEELRRHYRGAPPDGLEAAPHTDDPLAWYAARSA